MVLKNLLKKLGNGLFFCFVIAGISGIIWLTAWQLLFYGDVANDFILMFFLVLRIIAVVFLLLSLCLKDLLHNISIAIFIFLLSVLFVHYNFDTKGDAVRMFFYKVWRTDGADCMLREDVLMAVSQLRDDEREGLQ